MATFVFPASVTPWIKSIHEEIREDVIKAFPCPEGYEEIEFGYNGPAFNRMDLRREVEIVTNFNNCNHDIGIVIVIERGTRVDQKNHWFVKKI